MRMNKAPLGAKRKDCAGAKQNPATKDRSESGSTEVRKERSEGTLRKKYRFRAKQNQATKDRSEATRLRLGRFRAKVLVVFNIGSERRYSTEVRKERSEAARLIRRGARRLL